MTIASNGRSGWNPASRAIPQIGQQRHAARKKKFKIPIHIAAMV
jgi:hypothetical protein